MDLAERIEFTLLCEPVARRLWGEPNCELSTRHDLRWGTHGARSVNRQTGRWYDHEAKEGGSTVELLKRELGLSFSEASAWLRREGMLGVRPNGRPNGQFKTNGRSKTEPLGKITATYDYRNEDGQLLYQVVRLEPKTFRQRQPDGRSGWVWSVKGVRPVLYRLPELLEVAQERPVLVVEGEKDADNLARLGVTATTNAGGAGKWRAEYSETLRGADVILLPDNDEAGRDHMHAVAAFLAGIVARSRVLDLAEHWPQCPAKGDISDWITAGGTVEELWRLVETTPEWKPDERPQQHGANKGESVEKPWPTMDEAAFHGLAGDIVRTLDPHTEADPIAILVQTLTSFGNLIGRGAYHRLEATHHHANLFVVLAGQSSKARKGTSGERVNAIAKVVDPTWAVDRVKGGLSSGEGFINEVRDPVMRWDAKAGVMETVDPGTTDKRLLVHEPEFAGALAVAERHGNTLSPLIRKAWDGGKLATMTRNSPLVATDAHVSIIAHITEDELKARLTRTDMANGFANRFLFALVRRSKLLPFGGDLSDSEIVHLGELLKARVEFARSAGRITWTDNARKGWAKAYPDLSADRPGLVGAITARAEAQTIRLAMIYALLDGRTQIDIPHLRAALAVWGYCESSAQYIFGHMLGDPLADGLLQAIRRAGENGMTRTEIRDLFGRHQSAERIDAALVLLAGRGLVRSERRGSGGRPAEVWIGTGEAGDE
jgi:hypothetical protein